MINKTFPTVFVLTATGMQWAPGDFTKLEAGDPICLVRQPDNQFDKNAIEIRDVENKVRYGYIKASEARNLGAVLDDYDTCVDGLNYYSGNPRGFRIRLRAKATLNSCKAVSAYR